MTEHLKLVKENAYLKLGIITLIEAIDEERQLNGIKDFLKDLDMEEYDEFEYLRKTKGILETDKFIIEEEK